MVPANKTSLLCSIFDWFVTFSTSGYKVVKKQLTWSVVFETVTLEGEM